MNITKQTIRRIAVVLSAILLITATVFAVVFGLKGSRETGMVDLGINHNDNVLLTPESGALMKVSVRADYGGFPGEEESEVKAYSLSATIGPVTAGNQQILWTLKWKSSSEESDENGGQHSGGANRAAGWGEGKPVGSYVELSEKTSASGESVTLSCKQDFGEQIIVTATAAENHDIYATCTVDYCQKIKSLNYTFKYGGTAMSAPAADSDGVYRVDYTGEENSYSVQCVPVYTNYTVGDEFTQAVSGKFTSAFGHTASSAFSDISLQAGLFDTTEQEGNFNGGTQFESVDELLTAAKACNDAGTGIAEYTITFTGAHSSKTFTFKLGYTGSSIAAARTMHMSLPSVMF